MKVQCTFNMDKDLHKDLKIRSAHTGETMGAIIERLVAKEIWSGTANAKPTAHKLTPDAKKTASPKGCNSQSS